MANNLKDLMRMSEAELIGLGAQYGLSFNPGMRKRDMAQQLESSAASGWMETNSQLMEETYTEDDKWCQSLKSVGVENASNAFHFYDVVFEILVGDEIITPDFGFVLMIDIDHALEFLDVFV